MKHYEALSYCGIYCGSCKNYKQNVNCAGCREEKVLLSDCPTRVCAAKKGYLHCGECDIFPCDELDNFYNSGKEIHKQAYFNILEIKRIGIDEWLKNNINSQHKS